MVEIRKGKEPEALAILRTEAEKRKLSPHAAYKLLQNPEKTVVLEALKRDQGQLCVYCMSKIPRDDRSPGMKGESIEHFIPLNADDVGQALDYNNLFAVCHGNEKRHVKGTRRNTSEDDLTCDKHRKDTPFRRINPLKPETLRSITYTPDGRISADDEDVAYDLIQVLNLNCSSSTLVSERKAALDMLISEIDAEDMNEIRNRCVVALEGFTTEANPRTPYVGILIWYLKDMIKALS